MLKSPAWETLLADARPTASDVRAHVTSPAAGGVEWEALLFLIEDMDEAVGNGYGYGYGYGYEIRLDGFRWRWIDPHAGLDLLFAPYGSDELPEPPPAMAAKLVPDDLVVFDRVDGERRSVAAVVAPGSGPEVALGVPYSDYSELPIGVIGEVSRGCRGTHAQHAVALPGSSAVLVMSRPLG